MLFRSGKPLTILLCAFCLLISFSSQASAVITPLNDDTEFVKQVYSDFLNRQPDADGLTYWVNQLNASTLDRSELVEQYLNSNEFGVTVSPVVRLYFAYYQRIPDYEGLMFWVNSYAAGMSLNNVSDAFATAQEFIDRYGSLSNEEFVSKMYINVYGRQPDAGGLAYWTDILDNSALTRGQVMVEFSSAEEYLSLSANQVYVTMTYMGLLRRAPEQSGFEYWAGVMDGGASGLGLISSFLLSDEYAARFNLDEDKAPAEGMYSGVTNNGRTFKGLVLDDGIYYLIYTVKGYPDFIGGVIQGNLSASNGDFASSNARDFSLEGAGVLNATSYGTYVQNESIRGTLEYSYGEIVSFSGSYNTSYNLTPSLSTISGAYDGEVAFALGYEMANLSISSTGVISGVGESGCQVSGTITPRSSGNVYNASVSFGGTPCYYAYQTMSGIGYYETLSSSLYLATPNSSRTEGMLFVGQKR